VDERLLGLLLPAPPARPASGDPARDREAEERRRRHEESREKLRKELEAGNLEDRTVEVEVSDSGFPGFQIMGSGGEEMNVNIREMLPGMFSGRRKQRRMRIGEAREVLGREEEDRLIDTEEVAREAIPRVEQSGIIFLDEIDKVAGREAPHGPDVSREGVQRDLLPIVEGTSVKTKYGMVRTDHILFIAAGAFHVSKPSDLIPEMQGRFPIRVELDSLDKSDFVRILTEPKNALLLQYMALLRTEGVAVVFEDDAVAEIAAYAEEVNAATENIGARRLHTLMESLLEDILFEAPDMAEKKIVIDRAYVEEKLAPIKGDEDLSRFIL
jgi:ATP-dependent HslUV protease ATP-binding subunit HslU